MSNATPVSTFLAHQWLCDHFGHLNVRHYAAAFDDAIFHFWDGMGVAAPSQGDAGVVPVTGRLTLEFRSEVVAGTALTIFARIARIGQKSVTVGLEMRETRSGRLAATCETVEVFFDAIERASRVIPNDIRVALARRVETEPASNGQEDC